jgi:hypothetical protein
LKHILPNTILLAAALCMSAWAAEPDSANNIAISGDLEVWVPFEVPTHSRPVVKLPENLTPERFDATVDVPGDDNSLPVGVTIAPDRMHKHGGDIAARIENTDQEQTGVLSLREIPVEPNTEYLVRVWIKGEDIAGDLRSKRGAAVWVKYGPKEDFWKSPLTGSKMFMPENPAGTFPWTKFEFKFSTPADIGLLRVSLQLRKATGTLWFDDLEVIPVL